MTDDQLSGRDLDAAVAERVMGWKRGLRFGNGNGEWNNVAGYSDRNPLLWSQTPRFSSSIEAAMQVEDRIAELGLTVMADYFNALARIVAQSITERTMQMFDLVHATAEQRCLAALSAMEDKKSD